MLNRFHFWFPGGIALGGVIIWLLETLGVTAWQWKILIVVRAAKNGQVNRAPSPTYRWHHVGNEQSLTGQAGRAEGDAVTE